MAEPVPKEEISQTIGRTTSFVVAPELRVADETDRRAELEMMRREALRRMEEMRILELRYDRNERRFLVINNLDLFRRNRGEVVVDGEAQEMKLSEIVYRAAPELFWDERYGGGRHGRVGEPNRKGRANRTLYWLFRDEKVITRDEYEPLFGGRSEIGLSLEEIPYRSLFYIPPSEPEAFKVDSLRKAAGRYYLFFSEVSRGWTGVHPTLTEDFESSLTVFEAVTSEMLYGLGNGQRDSAGVLRVRSDIHNPESPMERINGQWLVRNFGVTAVAGTSWDASPAKVMQLHGQRLSEKGLLGEKDFARTGRETVDGEGRWYLNRTRYNLGSEYAGCTVLQVSEDEYLVLRGSKPELWFSSKIPGEKQGLVRTVEIHGRVTRLAPYESFAKKRLSEMDYKLVRSGGKERRVGRIRMAEEASKLLAFKQTVEQRLGSTAVLNQFSLENQVAINKVASTLGYENVWNYMRVTGEPGLHLMVDGFRRGNFDPRILGIVEHAGPRLDALFAESNRFSQEVNRLADTLQNRISQAQFASSLRGGLETFAARVRGGFELRESSFFIAASEGYLEVAREQIRLLGDALAAINDVFSGGPRFSQEEVQLNRARGGDSVTSVTSIYESSSGEKLTATIRPEAVESDHRDKAQAGFRVRYRRPGGEEMYLRIDRDEFGTSLDIGSREAPIQKMLEAIGQSHHTQETFDPTFRNPKIFAENMRALSQLLGYRFGAEASAVQV